MKKRKIAQLLRKDKDYLVLGPSPIDEPVTQCGVADPLFNIMEVEALHGQMLRIHGAPPEGVEYFMLHNEHEYGDYYELAILFDASSDGGAAEDFAYYAEAHMPERWDSEAKSYLIDREHPLMVAKVINMRRSA